MHMRNLHKDNFLMSKISIFIKVYGTYYTLVGIFHSLKLRLSIYPISMFHSFDNFVSGIDLLKLFGRVKFQQ